MKVFVSWSGKLSRAIAQTLKQWLPCMIQSLEICKATNGWLTFVSGDDCLRVYPNGNGVYGARFKGTALGIRIKPSCVSEYQSLIDSVRKSGEDTAKAIKNSFKEASTPSKGLMY